MGRGEGCRSCSIRMIVTRVETNNACMIRYTEMTKEEAGNQSPLTKQTNYSIGF